MKKTEKLTYGIIGLGRFGMALAASLAEAGCDILVLDKNEEKIRQVRAYTDHAYVTSSLSKETLTEAGIPNCDVVVVGIGKLLDVSILTTLTVVSLGVKRVIAKATTPEQGEVLQKLGAEVVYPESDMAVRLAKKLTSGSLIEFLSLSNEIEISEILLTDKLIGKNLAEANLRGKFSLNIIALEHGDNTQITLSPDYVFAEGDIIVVIGRGEDIRKFQNFLSA
ncbi:MAG: TrkA family potassium uptake protein [Clostridia bacterium]|nr:TrkA family potassium uptake protein [Clostridia bacterium]